MNHKIEIVGLGGGDIDQLPFGIYKKLINNHHPVFVRTEDHPVIKDLKMEGVPFVSFDSIYQQSDNFEDIYNRIVSMLLEEVQKQSIVYAVPGHPMLAEQTVQLLLNQQNISIEIVGGQSYLDVLFTALKIDPIDGFQLIDGTAFNREALNYQHHIVFCQVYDQFIASEIKLVLLEDLPADYKITILDAVGSKHETLQTIPLQELDRIMNISNLTSVYVPPVPSNLLNHTFNRLRYIVATLRGPEGCLWDQAQTHESLREHAIEEVYELIEAIDLQDDEAVIEELGDVLLQVVLHSQIGEDTGYFTIDDVIRKITNKMIYRHPHVFEKVSVSSIEDIQKKWDELKLKEKGETQKSILDGVPKGLPSLVRAIKMQKKVSKVGFDWDHVKDIWLKIDEELKEVKRAVEKKDLSGIEQEIGDVLFSIVNLARHYKVNPEIALNRTNHKFFSRFRYIESVLRKKGIDIEQASLKELDKYWDEAKRKG